MLYAPKVGSIRSPSPSPISDMAPTPRLHKQTHLPISTTTLHLAGGTSHRLTSLTNLVAPKFSSKPHAVFIHLYVQSKRPQKLRHAMQCILALMLDMSDVAVQLLGSARVF